MAHEPHDRLLYEPETFRIQGAVFEVNRVMGAGFLEAVYQEALSREFELRCVPFVAKPQISITYKGVRLKQTYEPDFICFDRVIVELKAVREIAPEHRTISRPPDCAWRCWSTSAASDERRWSDLNYRNHGPTQTHTDIVVHLSAG